MKVKYLVAAFLIIVSWGLNVVVGKIGVQLLSPIFYVALRSTLVALLLLPFLKSFPKEKLTFLMVTLFYGVLQFVFFFVGLSGVDGSVAAIAIQSVVPFGLILGRIKFNERMRLAQIIGLIVAFTGIVVVAGEPQTSTRLGYLLLVVCAAFSTAFGSGLIKGLGEMSVFRMHGWIALCSTPILFIVSFLLEDNQLAALTNAGWAGWATVAFAAVFTTIIGHGLWAYLLQNLPMYRVMPINLLVAVAAVIFSVTLLNETLTVSILIGGTMTILGVAVIQFVQAKPNSLRVDSKPT